MCVRVSGCVRVGFNIATSWKFENRSMCSVFLIPEFMFTNACVSYCYTHQHVVAFIETVNNKMLEGLQMVCGIETIYVVTHIDCVWRIYHLVLYLFVVGMHSTCDVYIQ